MLAFLCRYSCSKRELKKELTLLSFLSRCLSASPTKAAEQQNDLSKSFIAEPSASPCLSSKLFRKHLSMYLKGRLVIVPFTVQICGTKKIDYAHASPLQVNCASASTLSCLLRFGITDTMYLLYAYIFLINQAPEMAKLFDSYPTYSE